MIINGISVFGKLPKGKYICTKMLLVESFFYPEKITFVTYSVAGVDSVKRCPSKVIFYSGRLVVVLHTY